jgi:hypothetical protein
MGSESELEGFLIENKEEVYKQLKNDIFINVR